MSEPDAFHSASTDRVPGWLDHLLAAFLAAGCVLLCLFPSIAQAQEAVLQSLEDGPIGLAGMLAGLLFFALIGLYHHNLRSRSTLARLGALETALEQRDDKIWQLEERLARATELVDAQGDLVLREDSHGRVTHASNAVATLTAKEARDVVGHDLPFKVLREGERTSLPDGSVNFDQEIETVSGPRWFAWKVASVRDEKGDVVETQRVGREITARVAAERALGDAREKAEAASRAKSRFLAVVSHEVRTPLNGILGMADLLLDTPLSPDQQTYARAVKTSGDALLGLIEEVLDFSKIEAGRLDLESMPFNLRALVTDVIELIAPRAQTKGIEIAADIGDDIPLRVVGDAARLRQVLLNLAGNAVKFTDVGGVAVIVERAKDGRIAFEISDTGPGIEPEVRQRIFQEFEQGDATLARRHGGTGLGLAIAARIVERMGGSITLDKSDDGSHFHFTVELPAVDGPEKAEPLPDLAGANILVASPSPTSGPLLARRMTLWNGNVTLVSDASLAEMLLPEREWQHVLIDRAFGAQASKRLAAAAQRHAGHRHVLLSPAERGELDNLRDAGFDSYLVKPVRAASLAARLAAPGLSPPLVPELEQEPLPSSLASGKSLMVLVAEDNEINALLIQAMLSRLGHAPTVVGNGISAVTTVATAHAMGAPYDVVLMDLHLPGMDGFDATRRIRSLGDEGGRIPIVALTANAFAEDREACRHAGMNGFVVKPVDRTRLETAMRDALAGQQAEPAV
ncbi:MAG TPA: ATP-binding protein [Xanthobacteraceae bacterium]|nr:ATP-binding protein [Xanthobacteraceae bacterium]